MEGETSAPETAIVVSVDLSPLESGINGLSADIQEIDEHLQSMAEVQESMLVEIQDLQAASVKSTDTSVIAILIIIGIILSFSMTLWLFRGKQ